MMKIAGILLSCSALLHAQLTFSETEVTCQIPAEAETFAVELPFSVAGAVSLKEIDEKCSCMKGGFSGQKTSWTKGEKGVLHLQLDTSLLKKSGKKSLDLHFTDHPSQTLTFNLALPVGITSDVKKQKWKVGDVNPSAKTFLIEISPDFDFDLETISRTSTNFDFQLLPQEREKGKAYHLVVTPKDLSEKSLCLFKLETNSKITRYKSLSVIAIIEE